MHVLVMVSHYIRYLNLKCCSLLLNRGIYSVAIISVTFNTLDPSQQSNMAFRSFRGRSVSSRHLGHRLKWTP